MLGLCYLTDNVNELRYLWRWQLASGLPLSPVCVFQCYPCKNVDKLSLLEVQRQSVLQRMSGSFHLNVWYMSMQLSLVSALMLNCCWIFLVYCLFIVPVCNTNNILPYHNTIALIKKYLPYELEIVPDIVQRSYISEEMWPLASDHMSSSLNCFSSAISSSLMSLANYHQSLTSWGRVWAGQGHLIIGEEELHIPPYC